MLGFSSWIPEFLLNQKISFIIFGEMPTFTLTSPIIYFDSPDAALKVTWFLSFQRRNQPFDAWKFSTFNPLANISALS